MSDRHKGTKLKIFWPSLAYYLSFTCPLLAGCDIERTLSHVIYLHLGAMGLFSPAPCCCCPSISQKAAAYTFLQESLGWATGMLWIDQLSNSSHSQEKTSALAKHKASLCQGLSSYLVVSDGKAIQIYCHLPYLLCCHYLHTLCYPCLNLLISFWGWWIPKYIQERSLILRNVYRREVKNPMF